MSRERKPYAPAAPFEDLTFHPSTETTLGVELELQVLDARTSDLAPGAGQILDLCEEAGLDGVTGEFLLSMLEVRTDVCRNVDEVRESLFPLIRQVRHIAKNLGYALAVGGTHPHARPAMSAVSPGERYQRLRRKQGWFANQENIFGLHVHVGVPGGDEAIGLMNLLSPYLPHLLALSANSPFWEGVDTGFASSRTYMFRPAAVVGVPPHFESWSAFGEHCHYLHQAGILESTKNLYWDFRPRPGFGTLEFRVFDAPFSLDVLLGLTALARAMVIDGLRLLRERPQLLRGDPRQACLASENKWLAARYGLDAKIVRRPGRERCSIAEETASLLERLTPIAAEVGDDSYLAGLQSVLAESGADRQRQQFRATGEWQSVVQENTRRLAMDVGSVESNEREPVYRLN